MSNGEPTTRLALSLRQQVEDQGFIVLHDHRQGDTDTPGRVGKLRIWFGDAPKRVTLLADLDIATSQKITRLLRLLKLKKPPISQK